MGRILILPKESAFTETELPGLDSASLPLQYMSDYSILALRVDNYEVAQSLLEEEHCQFNGTPVGLNVVVDDVTRLQNLLQLFEAHGIAAELTDIAAQIYQG